MAQFVKLVPENLKALREVNPRLMSYNVEFAEVTGGTFWKAYTPEQVAGTEEFHVAPSADGIAAMYKDLMLFLGWMIFILLAVVFYFYFFSDLDLRMFNKDKATQTDAQQTNQTGFSYETNANLDINSLIIEYYAALAVCDQDKLKTYVTDPSQFDDMTVYQQRSAVIKAYSNVNCYTMPGYTEDATLVYVTSNLSMANITSVPLNINQFYVVKTADGYKIDNSAHSQEVTNYIETQSQSTDIQNLYKAVQDNVNSCIANDAAFAEFYNTISSGQ